MYRRMGPKDLEKLIEELRKKKMKTVIPVLEGYNEDGPVFGQKEVSEEEIAELEAALLLDRP